MAWGRGGTIAQFHRSAAGGPKTEMERARTHQLGETGGGGSRKRGKMREGSCRGAAVK